MGSDCSLLPGLAVLPAGCLVLDRELNPLCLSVLIFKTVITFLPHRVF